MPLVPVHTRLGEKAIRETCYINVQGLPGLPDGQYGFLELYCDDPGCDCRRVCLQVFPVDGSRKILATISYGWESVEFYQKKGHDRASAEEYSGATLDPLNIQTAYSVTLLEIFLDVVLTDSYEERLKQHYRMFKADVKKKSPVKIRHKRR